MSQFYIDYFGEKTIGYFGTKDGAIEYAESFARNLILTYDGDIVISDDQGRVVAVKTYIKNNDGCAYEQEWEVL